MRSLSKVNVDGWRFSHISFTMEFANPRGTFQPVIALNFLPDSSGKLDIMAIDISRKATEPEAIDYIITNV